MRDACVPGPGNLSLSSFRLWQHTQREKVPIQLSVSVMVAGQLRHVLTPSRSQIAPSRSCCVPRSDRRQALKVSASAKPSHAPAEAVASRRDALIAGEQYLSASKKQA